MSGPNKAIGGKFGIDHVIYSRYKYAMTTAEIIKTLRQKYKWSEISRMTGTGIRQLEKIAAGQANPSGALARLLDLIRRHKDIRKELLE